MVLPLLISSLLHVFASDPLSQVLFTESGQKTTISAEAPKAILLVNIATRCGYTPQLKGLEALYQAYKKRDLLVVGIPSNDFGQQTPEDLKGVQKFCKLRYGVTFPLTVKTVVSGPNKAPWFRKLLQSAKSSEDVQWNFEKFLLAPNGDVLQRFPSSVTPEAQALRTAIESAITPSQNTKKGA